MALAVGDILQISDVQMYLGQTVLNVYFYEMVSLESLTDYGDVQGAFKLGVIDEVRTMQNSGLTHTTIIVKNLTNEVDIGEYAYTVTGDLEDEGLQSFTALSIRLVRSTGLTRHGSKRIGGLTEAMVAGNVLSAAGNALIGNVVDALEADLVVDGTVDHDFVARPVIVGRFLITDPNPGELDLSKINPVSAAQFIRLSTQTTRRAGRGI
jgi:hypothetical protein